MGLGRKPDGQKPEVADDNGTPVIETAGAETTQGAQGTEPEQLPEAVVGAEEQLALAGKITPPPSRGLPDMPDDWMPDEIRFEMRTTPIGRGGKVALGANVRPDDDPAEIFARLRYALWQAAHGVVAEAGAQESKHCLTCGAPNWAGDPRRVGKVSSG